MIILPGSSHPELAKKIAAEGTWSLADVELTRLPNSEARPRILTDVEGQDVAIIQSLVDPVDAHLVELLLLIDACRRMQPKHLTVVLPWMGYSLQNKVFRKGEPLSAEVIAHVIGSSGADRVITLDLHAPEIVDMFGVPTANLTALPLFADKLKREQNILIVGPDKGSEKRVLELSRILGVRSICLRKERSLETGEVVVPPQDVNVQGNHCVLLDDVIVGGSTITTASRLLKENGASRITVCATHGLFVRDAVARLRSAPLDRIIITDSVPMKTSLKQMEVVSIDHLLTETLSS